MHGTCMLGQLPVSVIIWFFTFSGLGHFSPSALRSIDPSLFALFHLCRIALAGLLNLGDK